MNSETCLLQGRMLKSSSACRAYAERCRCLPESELHAGMRPLCLSRAPPIGSPARGACEARAGPAPAAGAPACGARPASARAPGACPRPWDAASQKPTLEARVRTLELRTCERHLEERLPPLRHLGLSLEAIDIETQRSCQSGPAVHGTDQQGSVSISQELVKFMMARCPSSPRPPSARCQNVIKVRLSRTITMQATK